MKRCLWVGMVCLVPFMGLADERFVVGDFSLGVDAKGVPKEWQLKERFGQADFSVVKDEGLHALQFRSAATSFSFQKQVNVDLGQFPVLSWKWKITKLPECGDFRQTKTDDQSAQLFLAFSRTKSIVYLWDTTAPQGLMGDAKAPPLMSIKVVVVRSGSVDLGKWLTETRNVVEDYRKLYGEPPKPLVVSGMRMQINSQHTKSSAESAFADLVFSKATQAWNTSGAGGMLTAGSN